MFPLNVALFHGQAEVLRDLLPRVDGHVMVLVVSCRHLVQVRVLADFLRQTLFQVVHSPKLKTQLGPSDSARSPSLGSKAKNGPASQIDCHQLPRVYREGDDIEKGMGEEDLF